MDMKTKLTNFLLSVEGEARLMEIAQHYGITVFNTSSCFFSECSINSSTDLIKQTIHEKIELDIEANKRSLKKQEQSLQALKEHIVKEYGADITKYPFGVLEQVTVYEKGIKDFEKEIEELERLRGFIYL